MGRTVGDSQEIRSGVNWWLKHHFFVLSSRVSLWKLELNNYSSRDGQCFLRHSVNLLFSQGKENAFNDSKGNTFATAFILLLQLSSIVCHQQEFGRDFTLAHSGSMHLKTKRHVKAVGTQCMMWGSAGRQPPAGRCLWGSVRSKKGKSDAFHLHLSFLSAGCSKELTVSFFAAAAACSPALGPPAGVRAPGHSPTPVAV